jgi:hypothetical protein
LTIKARNARLIDVLREACRQIGAELDAQAAADQPILGVAGPGPAMEVLTSLLSELRVDYALARSADDPNVLARVALYAKAPDTGPGKGNGIEMAKLTDTGTAKATDSKATGSAATPAVPQHLTDLFGAAKAEIASYTPPSDSQDEEASAEADVMKALQADPGILKQIEDKINAAADAKPSANANPNPPQQPVVAGRHRGRH